MKTIKQYYGTVTYHAHHVSAFQLSLALKHASTQQMKKMHQTLTSVLSPTRPLRSNDTVYPLESRAVDCYVIKKN